MKKISMVLAIAALAVGVITGCTTITRESVAKEYERVAALPPAVQIHSPNKSVDDVGRLACDVRNAAHRYLVEYVSATSNHREYTGFMNDVQFVVKSEGLSEVDAIAKVSTLIQEEDKTRPEGEKVWPRIVEGWVAVDALDPKKKFAEISAIVIRNRDVGKSLKKINTKVVLQHANEMSQVGVMVTQTFEILSFLGDQYMRVQKMKFYKK